MTARIAGLAAVLALTLAGCFGTTKESIRNDIKSGTTRYTIESDLLADAASYRDAYDRDAGNPDRVVALFFSALLMIETHPELGMNAAVYMCRANDQWKSSESHTGVVPSQAAKEGYKRLQQHPEAVRSYCGSSGPPNYTLNDPTRIKISVKQVDNINGDKKYFVESDGKDNASPLTLREVDGKWVVEEWSSIQTTPRRK